MRHNFVNDIGDYAKYALLRALCAHGTGGARLGVLWYLTEHPETNGDGRRRAHLSGAGWDALDPEGSSVVLYQHADRSPWQAQRARICSQLGSMAGPPVAIRSLRFGAFGARAFFCVSTDGRLAADVDNALDALTSRVAGWDRAHHVLIE